MNRENNGAPEDLGTHWQHMADVAAAARESLYRLEGEFSYLAEQLSSLADYSIGTLSGEAIR
jgi:hypothetical protein